MYRCTTCNYVADEDDPPANCPNCGAPAAKLSRLSDKAADLIERSRFGNSLLMQLHLLMDQVLDVAEDGLDDNLDPGCTHIFEVAMGQAEELQQLVKAELQTHVAKGRWG
jgi:hypothetical protein